MDVRFLNTFIEVANTRHFGKAAENLYLTQSAVSARIRHLEEYFNAPLFVRERHSIRLTGVGEQLLPYAKTMVNTLQSARKAVEQADVKHLSLAATDNVWHLCSDSIMAATKSHFPSLSLHCELLGPEQISRQLNERTVDVALSFESLKSDDFVNEIIGQIDLRLYAVSNTSVEDALTNFIQVNWHTKLHAMFAEQYPKCRYSLFQTNSLKLALKRLKIEESASILLPPHIGDKFVREGKLEELARLDDISISLGVSCLKSTKQTALADFFDFYTNASLYADFFKKR